MPDEVFFDSNTLLYLPEEYATDGSLLRPPPTEGLLFIPTDL